MMYQYNGRKIKLSKVRLFRRNYNSDSDSCFDYDNYFGELIVYEVVSGYRELLTGTKIPVVNFIDERDYHQGIWEHVPCGPILAEEDQGVLTESEVMSYINNNDINGFADRLFLFNSEAKKASFEHFKDKLSQKIRIRK